MMAFLLWYTKIKKAGEKMFRYPSNIIFLYFKDFNHGQYIMEDVLDLSLVMDQGFAKVYQINQKSFIGIVQIKDKKINPGNALISLNSRNLEKDYQRIKTHNIKNLTGIKPISSIGLHSFFFEDGEGHRFEIQRFDDEINRQIFE